MEIVLLDIVQSNYCYYNIHPECVEDLELPDDIVCGKCIAEAHAKLIPNAGIAKG